MDVSTTINGLSEKDFLAKYNHRCSTVSEVGLDWERLILIFEKHRNAYDFLNKIAEEVHKQFRSIPGAYIVRYRVKDPEHLVDKVIRKKISQGLDVTEDNYIDAFDDLIGFRILHLFKNDWLSIHEYLTKNFEQNEQPVAYHRRGDSPEFLKGCEDMDIRTEERDAGYRSIHYVNKFDALGRIITYEVQVRTVIEDAWSEIDHLVRYPNNTDNDLINRYLLIFNAFAGAADEMGTFLMQFKQNLNKINIEHAKRQDELYGTIEAKIDQLMNKINSGMAYLPQMPDYQIPSFAETIAASRAPSFQNPYDRLDKLRTSIEETLSNATVAGANPLLGAIPNFEMPKPGYPMPNMEKYIWPASPKKKRK